MYDLEKKSIEKIIEGIKKIEYDSKTEKNDEFKFQSFKAKNSNCKLGVIDGSNYNIRGINCVLTLLKAGVQYYQGRKIVGEKIDPIMMELITNSKDGRLGFQIRHEEYYESLTGELPTYAPEFEKVVERIRTILEWKKVVEAVEKLEKGDIVLFDGSLISGVISTSHTFYRDLSQKAKEKGIILAGLSKDSSLSINSSSLPMLLHNLAEKKHPNQNWFVKYKDTYFVRFTMKKEYIFRLDAVLPKNIEIEELLSTLAAYAHGTELIGYVFPMESIHSRVRISKSEAEYSYNVVQQEAMKSGINKKTFDRIFSIYHDQLDLISSGR